MSNYIDLTSCADLTFRVGIAIVLVKQLQYRHHFNQRGATYFHFQLIDLCWHEYYLQYCNRVWRLSWTCVIMNSLFPHSTQHDTALYFYSSFSLENQMIFWSLGSPFESYSGSMACCPYFIFLIILVKAGNDITGSKTCPRTSNVRVLFETTLINLYIQSCSTLNFHPCELPVAYEITGSFYSSITEFIYNLHISMEVMRNPAFLDQTIPGML